MENWEKDIFKNRNQQYGSFWLRKKYPFFLLIGFVIALIIITIPIGILLYKYQQKLSTDDLPVNVIIDLSHPVDISKLIPEPPPQEKVLNKEPLPDIPKLNDFENDKKKGDASVKINNIDTAELLKKHKSVTKIENKTNDTADFIYVDELPQFIGGNEEFIKFIRKNLIIPDSLVKKHIRGKLILQILISNTGEVTRIKIISGVNSYIDREALRVVNEANKWIPAKRNGRAVSFIYNIPIRI